MDKRDLHQPGGLAPHSRFRWCGLFLSAVMLTVVAVHCAGQQIDGQQAGGQQARDPFSAPAVDCSLLSSSGDPRCQLAPRTPSAMRPADSLYPGVPVIRDGFGQNPREFGRQVGAQVQPLVSEQSLGAPEAPTEFQRFVQQATGLALPIFGESLFDLVPSTFAPADRIPVTADYALAPGDQLIIRGWGQIDLNLSPVIDRAGAIYVPQVGEVRVAGLKFSQIQDYLKTAIGRVYHNFELSVSMGQLRSIQVFVVGFARRPGAYTISSLSTLVNALFASGGPGRQGTMRAIRLMRGSKVVTEFDLYELLVFGDMSRDAALLQGDVIYIPPVGPQIAMTGSVNKPAIYEIKDGDDLERALKLAGGLTPLADRRRTFVERINGSTRRALQFSFDTADLQAKQLHNGDIVNILALVPKFEGTVTLRGNVADPVRVPWRPGMRIRDLIPNREALLTRDYWRNRNRLVPAGQQRESGSANEFYPSDRQSRIDRRDERFEETTLPRVEGQARDDAARTAVAEGIPDAPRGTGNSMRAAPGPLATAVAEDDSTRRSPRVAVPEVNWNYAVVERLDPGNLRTHLVPFNLGKVLVDGDESENLALEPGDVVTIYSTKDVQVPQALQTRYVRLEGEFVAAGIYTVRPNETLRQLAKRAGGFTPQAYLFGSVFQRESTRRIQQQRLDDFINSLERETASTAANIRGSVISPEDATAAAAQLSGQTQLINKLRQLRPTGRIVLSLDLNAAGADGLPDFELEDGDTFTVPSRPSFVSVVGSVYNSTSFQCDETKRLGDFLRAAGGATRTGDPHHTFLLRADGSVVSRSWASGILAQSFESLRLNPGDTIVVPEQINRVSVLKSLRDWSQVFSQFALGAAAINILR